MKIYKNKNEINKAVKRSNLERQIALEEVKYLKNEFKTSIDHSFTSNALKSVAKNYGVWFLIRIIQNKISKI